METSVVRMIVGRIIKPNVSPAARTDGFIRIDNRGQSCITTLGAKDGQQKVFDYSQEPPRSYILEFDDYIDAILNNQQPLPSGFDGLRAVQMAHAVYQSALLGREVKVGGGC